MAEEDDLVTPEEVGQLRLKAQATVLRQLIEKSDRLSYTGHRELAEAYAWLESPDNAHGGASA